MAEIHDRTRANLQKFKDRADELREELGDARAATKVQMKAMIERLEEKHEEAKERYDKVKRSEEDLKEFHDALVSELQTMMKTIRRRIH